MAMSYKKKLCGIKFKKNFKIANLNHYSTAITNHNKKCKQPKIFIVTA